MTIKFYDLAGARDEHRFSPYCWRIKMALAHKGLDSETIPWRFTEKDVIAASGGTTVPVIVDGDRMLRDSWSIAAYLDETYPERPALFGDEQAKAATLFLKFWAERVLHPLIARLIVADIVRVLHEKDVDYFRSSREEAFRTTLEDFCSDRETAMANLGRGLAPLRATLSELEYLGGEAPSFADYIVFGAFQWARCASPQELLPNDDPVRQWRERMLALYGGMAAAAHRPAA